MARYGRTSPTSASAWRSRTRPRRRGAPSSASSRTRRPCASSGCRRRSRAAELDRLEAFAKEWGAKGLAYLVFAEDGEVRSPIAKFLSEEELAALPLRPGLDRALRRGRAGARGPRARRAPPPSGARARADRRRVVALRLGHRLPDVRVGRGRGALEGRAPSVHAARAGLGGARRQRPRGRDRARVRPDRQRHRDRRRLVPDPRAGAPGAGLRRAAALRRRSSGRSSASCSTRSRWARRRTAASPSASSAC